MIDPAGPKRRNAFQDHIGVGTVNYALQRTGPTRQRRIIADEGPRVGKTAAIQTDHRDGRVDANVFVDTVKQRISLSGRAEE